MMMIARKSDASHNQEHLEIGEQVKMTEDELQGMQGNKTQKARPAKIPIRSPSLPLCLFFWF